MTFPLSMKTRMSLIMKYTCIELVELAALGAKVHIPSSDYTLLWFIYYVFSFSFFNVYFP